MTCSRRSTRSFAEAAVAGLLMLVGGVSALAADQDGQAALAAVEASVRTRLGGAVAERVKLNVIMAKRAVVTGSALRTRSAEEKAAIARSLRERVWPVLEQGRCLPIIHATYPLARAADAHRILESGQHIGKIVLEMA